MWCKGVTLVSLGEDRGVKSQQYLFHLLSFVYDEKGHIIVIIYAFISAVQSAALHVAAVVPDNLSRQVPGVVRVTQCYTVSTLPPVLPPVLVDRFGSLLRKAAQSPVAPTGNGDMGVHGG